MVSEFFGCSRPALGDQLLLDLFHLFWLKQTAGQHMPAKVF
ncbi:MAG TPA: hypothetical protein PK777_02065 [Thermoguttaceae bacterium]|nr:hypothetical protein [Thermoguttaceae bacterium]